MFDFLSSDWFTLALEIAFLIFIVYDLRNYVLTRRKEYLFNIALAIGFFIYTLWPLYNKYYNWSDETKELMQQQCVLDNNESYCTCLNDALFKEYDLEDYKRLAAKKDENLIAFLDETKEDCNEEFSAE